MSTNLKAYRRSLNLDINQLADAAQVTHATIVAMEQSAFAAARVSLAEKERVFGALAVYARQGFDTQQRLRLLENDVSAQFAEAEQRLRDGTGTAFDPGRGGMVPLDPKYRKGGSKRW